VSSPTPRRQTAAKRQETTPMARQPGRRRYGFFNFLFDVILTAITAGFWLIWIFVREMRNR
jgi:hypothetical protein